MLPPLPAIAADTAGFTPVAPALPDGWYANYARWNPPGADGVAFWDVGYVTAANTFIALRQSVTANPTWTAEQAQNAPVTGTRTIDGHDWELRDKPKGDRSLVLSQRHHHNCFDRRGRFQGLRYPGHRRHQTA